MGSGPGVGTLLGVGGLQQHRAFGSVSWLVAVFAMCFASLVGLSTPSTRAPHIFCVVLRLPEFRFPLEWETLLRLRNLVLARPQLGVELLGPSGGGSSATTCFPGAARPLPGTRASGFGFLMALSGGGAVQVVGQGDSASEPGSSALGQQQSVAVSGSISGNGSSREEAAAPHATAGPGHGRHGRLASGSDWSVSSDDLCGVCFDRPNGLHVLGCGHLLCIPCYRRVLQTPASGGTTGSSAPSCPFCRGRIDGFVYADWWVQRAAEHHLRAVHAGGCSNASD